MFRVATGTENYPCSIGLLPLLPRTINVRRPKIDTHPSASGTLHALTKSLRCSPPHAHGGIPQTVPEGALVKIVI